MYQKLLSLMERPEPYRRNTHPFWDDEHISLQMLKAHLDPDLEAASRSHAFMDRSADCIAHIAPPEEFPRLLDLGCGPGLYAKRFARKGYAVTGVDISRRSVQYAKDSAQAEGMEIRYLLCDYCRLDLNEEFDLATLIYCDFGVLCPSDRREVLYRANAHLRSGGRMILDVFSAAHERNFKDYQYWQHCPEGGFWREEPYIVMEEGSHFPEHVIGQQIAIITPEGMTPYYLWDTCFTPEMLAKEVEAAGFRVLDVYGDVAGTPISEDSDTIAMVMEKA